MYQQVSLVMSPLPYQVMKHYSPTFYSLSIETDKPLVITPGFVTDLTMGVLMDGGYDVRTVTENDYKGYVDQFQETMMETVVSQRAICLVNGLDSVNSYLDSSVSLGDHFTFDGTTYSIETGHVYAQDFRLQTRVRRNSTGQIIYDPTTVYLPSLASTGNLYAEPVAHQSLGTLFSFKSFCLFSIYLKFKIYSSLRFSTCTSCCHI